MGADNFNTPGHSHQVFDAMSYTSLLFPPVESVHQ